MAEAMAEVPAAKRRKGLQDGSVDDAVLTQLVAKPVGAGVTMQEIEQDKLTKIAKQHWWIEARGSNGKQPAFDATLVQRIYNDELGGKAKTAPSLKRIMLLEISQYLENYLWQHFDAEKSSYEHVMSIVLMVNEKAREGVPAWRCFANREDDFGPFFQRVLKLQGRDGMSMHERTAYLLFMIHAFQSLENKLVRSQVLRLVSLELWCSLSDARRQVELSAQEQLMEHWKRRQKRWKKAAKQGNPITSSFEATFIPSMVKEFLSILEAAVTDNSGNNNGEDVNMDGEMSNSGTVDRQRLQYCERFVEFMIDLLSQMPTRRFVRTLLDDYAVLIKCKLSRVYAHDGGKLFAQLVDYFELYMTFPVNDHTGESYSEDEVLQAHYDAVQQLQRLAFKYWKQQLNELAMSNCGSAVQPDTLRKHLAALDAEQLHHLVTKQLRMVAADDSMAQQPQFLEEVMLHHFQRRRYQTEVINEMPLYPTENILWNESQIPSINYTGQGTLALPKLNLQFLTIQDYLLRNFNLFRLEATYEIREDIADVLSRMGGYRDYDGNVAFRGWARMALPIATFKMIEVQNPKVGETKPAAVTADITINTRSLRGDVRGEWDELKQHDVLFLVTIRPPDEASKSAMAQDGKERSPGELHGLVYVRGCEIVEVKDEEGGLMNDFTGRVKFEDRKPPTGFLRTMTVALDTAQYQLDINSMQRNKSEDIYSTFNLVIRRKPKENNFKAVLESIRDLLTEDFVVPPWLHDVLLGYGDPAAAGYKHMQGCLQTIDFKDTFLDADHVRASFPNYDIEFTDTASTSAPANSSDSQITKKPLLPPYKITFPPFTADDAPAADQNGTGDQAMADRKKLLVQPYTPPNPGPFPQNKPKTNTVRFTPVQVEAILSGSQPGLTMVVGPPGTGKTDTAVQIMHVLYHNCPEQRTLLIAHSNQALNDLFAKIIERDVPARYLLRLGMGEADLDTELDFSRAGRVNAMLARRLELLAEVENMAKQFGVAEDVAYTCETAGHFWLMHVLARWEKFVSQCAAKQTATCVRDLFPFKNYFANAPQPLFKGESYAEDMEVARGCFRHLKTMFQELEECRAFELLKGQADRVNYLVTKQAKIVAMTCTHAALKRREFVEMGFKYDNLLMEESAQVLEIETFIPMLLQQPQDEHSRLKRVILVGDHNQLPPVVKNLAFQKFSHLDQSLFTRFVRLGVPFLELDAQGRARPSIAQLYNWRYRSLGDLPMVRTAPEYLSANAGFAYEYQFIDVPPLNGVGESEPVPWFYQNLGEAEYIARCYVYMRLIGYPARKISILTTYNGQKALLRDAIERVCSSNPALGRPYKITTVDKYQGQQNDYILLSLVRTRVVGHLRDVRRLVVAMSRARLGLYVFGCLQLFANCYELQPTFRLLQKRPVQLALTPSERYGACSRLASSVPHQHLSITSLQDMDHLVNQLTYEQASQQHF